MWILEELPAYTYGIFQSWLKLQIFRRIFDAVKLREDRKNMLAKQVSELNDNYSRRINGTAFSGTRWCFS
jgi:hypothetical protein